MPTTQERILDAPDLVDDYYLNLLDWSSNNVVRAGSPSPAHAGLTAWKARSKGHHKPRRTHAWNQ